MSHSTSLSQKLRESRALRYGTIGAMAFSSGDYVPYEGETLKQSLRLIGSGSWGANALKESARMLVKDFEPRMEEMEPARILAAGEAHPGAAPSPFVANPEILTAQDWQKLHLLTKQNLLSPEELNGFVNLFGVSYKQHAQAWQDHGQNPSPASRQRLADAHMDLRPLTVGLVMQVFSRKPELREKAKQGMTRQDVTRAFPRSSALAGAVQRIDDQGDLLIDLLSEHATGRVCTNTVLAIADHKIGLTHSQTGSILPHVVDDCRELLARGKPVKPHELPDILQEALELSGQKLREEVKDLNPVTRRLVHAAWEHGLKNGISPAKNERGDEAARRGLAR